MLTEIAGRLQSCLREEERADEAMPYQSQGRRP
ncbi:MAG: hypothetical protein IPG54_15105 [Sphingomonadales bacterium]|nr:hypothetical protein [Sphingomonadales bacterium]